MLTLYEVFNAGHIFIQVVTTAIFIYCILSWLRPTFRAFYVLQNLIRPFVAPFQKLSYRVMRYFRAPVDFSCLFALIAYQLVDRLWWALYLLLARRL